MPTPKPQPIKSYGSTGTSYNSSSRMESDASTGGVHAGVDQSTASRRERTASMKAGARFSFVRSKSQAGLAVDEESATSADSIVAAVESALASGATVAGSGKDAAPADSDTEADLATIAAAVGGGAAGRKIQYTTVQQEVDAIGFGQFHVVALIILGLANASDAIELLALSFILPQLPGFDDTTKSVLSAAIFFGMLLGGLVFGIMADSFGRKNTLVTSLLINAGFGVMSSFLPAYEGLIVTRIMAGFGVGGSVPGVFTLAAEYLPPQGRGFYLSTVAWWWMIGSCYAAGAAWIMLGSLGLDWRPFAIVCAIPAALAALLVGVFLPESPRYLHLRGDVDGASKVLLSIASWNNVKGRLSKGYRLTPHADHHLSKQQQNDGSSSGGVIDDDAIEVDASLSSLKQATSSSSAAAAAAGVDHDGDDASDEVDAEAPLVSSSSSSSGASNTADAARSSAFSKRQEENLRRSMRHEGLGSSSSGGAAGSCGGRWFLCSSAFWCCLCSRRGRSKFRSQWHDAMTPVREFFSPSLLRTSLLLMAVWFCLSLGWYGLTLWIPTIFHETNVDLDEYQDSFLVQAANLPGNLASALLMDRIGRKGVLTTSLILAGIAAVAFPFATTEATVLLCSCALNAASTCTWNALDCLSTESFPTSLRTTAMGLLAASGRIGSIAGQFIFGELIHVSLFALLGVAGGVLVLGAVAGVLLPKDPKGRRLQETVGGE